MIPFLRNLRQHLLTGVSYAIPFVACGGILIAAAIALAPMGPAGPDFTAHPTLKIVLDIGVAAFRLLLPILAAYIAYSVAGRPALVAGAVGGLLADDVKAGFLGALVAGLLAGYLVLAMKRIPTNRLTKPVMPILVIPVLSALVIGLLMLRIVGPPIADLMEWLAASLKDMSAGNAVALAAVLGAMIAFDMGGPVNKAAFFFAAGLIKEGSFGPMGAVAAAICTPPLGLGLATVMGRRLWGEEQRESGYAALGMGMIGITEGAIPFAAADPLRVIPCIVLGSVVAATTAMLGGVGNHAPHGGPIVLPVIDGRMMYIVAIVAGSLATALAINGIKMMRRAPIGAPARGPLDGRG